MNKVLKKINPKELKFKALIKGDKKVYDVIQIDFNDETCILLIAKNEVVTKEFEALEVFSNQY